ncbi:MAG: divergent polysaccharide deacetylase family protein [Celeribacter sp.]|jgi:hypothetical protein
MGRGILIGVIWGGLVSVVVLINVSLLSPLPVVVEDGALRPAPRGSEVGDLPGAGQAEGDGIIEDAPASTSEPAPDSQTDRETRTIEPTGPRSDDPATASVASESEPAETSNDAVNENGAAARIGLTAPEGEVTPRAPEGIDRQAGRVDPQIAPGIDLPAGSEFARARPDVTPALPAIDGAPAGASGGPAGLPRSAAPTDRPQPDTAPPSSPLTASAPGRGLTEPLPDSDATAQPPRAAMEADPALSETSPTALTNSTMTPDADPAAPLPPAETPPAARSAVTAALVNDRDAAPQVGADSAAAQVSTSLNAPMVDDAAPMQPIPGISEPEIADAQAARMVRGAPLDPIQPLQTSPVTGVQADAGPEPGTLDPVATRPGGGGQQQATPVDPLTGAPAEQAAPMRLLEVAPEPLPGTAGDLLNPSDGDAERPRIVTDQLLDQGDSAPVAGVITGRLPSIRAPEDADNTTALDAASDLELGAVPANETEAASLSSVGADTLPALSRYAMPFSNPLQLPLLSVVLLDEADGMGPEGLANLPFTVSVAIDPARDDLALRIAAYRAAGHEVLLLGRDVDGTLGDRLAGVEGIVAILEPDAGGFGTSRVAAQDAALIARRDGQGLVLWNRGLNGAMREADSQNVPAALIFRALDDGREDAPLIQRYMDRAAFEAIKTGAVIMIGHTYPDTLTALMGWSDSARVEDVALAPVSALLLGDPAAEETEGDSASDSGSDG